MLYPGQIPSGLALKIIFILTLKLFLGAGGGNLRLLRIRRPSPPLFSVGSDFSLFESPPDFLTTLEPFRVRFPLTIVYFLELVEGIEPPTC